MSDKKSNWHWPTYEEISRFLKTPLNYFFTPKAEPKPKPPRPHYNAEFTSPDLRLRPIKNSDAPHQFFTNEDKLVRITPSNFPELYKDISAMETRAGLSDYKIYIRKYVLNTALSNYSTKSVVISANQMNRRTYEELLSQVGHEFGHQWRHAHETHKPIPIRGGDFIHFRNYETHKEKTKKRDEAEAWLASYCLIGSAEPIKKMLSLMDYKTPESDTHPSTEQVIAAVEAASPLDCRHFDFNHQLVAPTTPSAGKTKPAPRK